MQRFFLALFFTLGVLWPVLAPNGNPAGAQGLNFKSGDSEDPIEIFADDGIEWQQEALIFVARGNAKAVRGNVEVYGDLLRAFYRKTPSGGTDIWRLDAIGKVKLFSSGMKSYGEKAVYDIDNAILVLSGGKKVRFITDTDIITAKKQIEYWEKKQMAVARGDAAATRGDKSIRADVLTAHFQKTKKGKTQVYRIEAFANVRIITPKEKVYSDRAVYNVNSGVATLAGSVKIIREGNRLVGCSAEVNMNTGVSKLFSCPQAVQGGKRVRGSFKTRSGKKK